MKTEAKLGAGDLRTVVLLCDHQSTRGWEERICGPTGLWLEKDPVWTAVGLAWRQQDLSKQSPAAGAAAHAETAARVHTAAHLPQTSWLPGYFPARRFFKRSAGGGGMGEPL